MPDETTGTCDLCGENPTTNNDFCYGCSQSVCETCSINFNLPFGDHDLEDHLYDPDDYDLDDEDDDDC